MFFHPGRLATVPAVFHLQGMNTKVGCQLIKGRR